MLQYAIPSANAFMSPTTLWNTLEGAIKGKSPIRTKPPVMNDSQDELASPPGKLGLNSPSQLMNFELDPSSKSSVEGRNLRKRRMS